MKATKLQMKNTQGFTLIEILVVIGIIAVLAAIVLIAINPARQFAQANNSQRSSNTNAILNAVGQYMADHQGDLTPLGIDTGDSTDDNDYMDINDTDAEALCNALVPEYIPALPVDPTDGDETAVEEADCDDFETGYTIIVDDTSDRVTVHAPAAQLSEEIRVTR